MAESFPVYGLDWALAALIAELERMTGVHQGPILLDANTIRLGSIPLGSAVDPLEGAPAGTTYTKQTVYELCSCANGKLYLSPAEKGSTCQTTSNFCLWS
ncbi:hypothetical protein WMY93_005718 [Mugilogobius chulae]|uniref:Uncharacterized protein n=1 Tax=Mugilogobius chulae TaxID=88201 RepID=A0AAW0PP21_9GOBI